MSKKIKIELKNIDNLEFVIKEDANKGDYFSLNELEQVTFDSLRKDLKLEKDKIIAEIWENEKEKIIYSSKEFRDMKEELDNHKSLKEIEINNLKNKLDNIKNEKEMEFNAKVEKLNLISSNKIDNLQVELNNIKKEKESELNAKILEINLNNDNIVNKLKTELSNVNNELNSFKQQMNLEKENSISKLKLELSERYRAKIDDLEKNIYSLETNNKNILDNKKHEIENAILTTENKLNNKHNDLISEKDKVINELESRRNLLNIKEIGENLERHMQSDASNNLSYPNTQFKKANDVIEGTKPDFIFEVLNDDKSILTSVTIEAKSETLNAKTKKKNNDHLEKLDSDRKKNNSEYALLVTELEKEDEFIFKKVGQYDNMYMVRPRYFVPFLQLVYNLSQKQMEISKLEIDFKEKQDILNEFEQFKTDVVETTLSKMTSKIETINKEAEKIISSTNKITESSRILESHLSTIENKFNKFKINKLIDKM